MTTLKWFFFGVLRSLVRKFANSFGHPTQDFTQVQLAGLVTTCESVWPGLKR